MARIAEPAPPHVPAPSPSPGPAPAGARARARARRATPPRPRGGPVLLATLGLVGVTAAWGSTFVIIKDAIDRIPAADFLAVRFAIAALVLFLARPGAVARLTPAQRRQGVALGVLYGVAQVTQTVGLAHTSASVSGFVTGMYVVFTPFLAAWFLRGRIGRTTWIAVAVATAGLALLALNGFSIGGGELITLASAVLYAAHIVGLGAWASPRTAYGLAVVQMAAVTAVCLVFAAPGGITLPVTGAQWFAVVFTALLAGAVGLVVQTWAQAHLSATRAAVIMTMEPVFAAGFAVALGGEALTARMLLGGALVLGAMYLSELGPRRGKDARVAHPAEP